MNERTADSSVANRDDPIPVINVQGENKASSAKDGKRDSLRSTVPDQAPAEAGAAETSSKHTRHQSLQDRLFTKFVSTSDGGDENQVSQAPRECVLET
jgi:hypothetical protein